MPTERMEEVEVVCGRCNGSGVEDYRTDPPRACWGCDRTKKRTALVPSGSLTAARLRLADAAEAKEKALDAFAAPEADEDGPECEAWLAAGRDYTDALSALAALRTARGEG